MSYHLRLSRGLSYDGIVSATKARPDVFVEDKATAEQAVATGYFTFVSGPAKAQSPDPEPSAPARNLSREWLATLNYDELKKLAGELGVDTKKVKKKADLIDALAAEEVVPGPETDEDGNEVDYDEE